MIKHLNIKIYGQVQGVFFRVSAQKEAERLNLTGIAQNKEDGTVYIEVEGEEPKIDQFLDWCWKGSFLAQVTDVKVTKGNFKNFTQFLI